MNTEVKIIMKELFFDTDNLYLMYQHYNITESTIKYKINRWTL